MKKRQALSILITFGLCTTMCPTPTLAEEVNTNNQRSDETLELEEESVISEENEEVEIEIQEETVTDEETEESSEESHSEESGSQPEIDVHPPKIDDGMFHYLDENGIEQSTDAHALELEPDLGNMILETGWYYVGHDWTFENRPSVIGDVKLILADGAALTMKHGIRVFEGQTLNVYAQSTGENMGKLIAGSYDNQAGIGGNNDENNGTINIYGGHIEATGTHQGAGIGGGDSGNGGEINIYGGDVHAEARITTPCVTKGVGAGIGGGDNGNGGTIRIYGGNVFANSAEVNYPFYLAHGAGIGGGDEGNGGTIEIYGGSIEAHGHHAIGAGKDPEGATQIILGDGVGVRNSNYEDRYNTLAIAQDLWVEHTESTSPQVSYISANGEVKKLSDYRRLSTNLDTKNCIYSSGWYVVDKDLKFENRPTIQGEVNLVLCDGVTLYMDYGIHNYVGQTLNIYAQSTGESMGKLICDSHDNQAGIGGNDDESNGTINIYGGHIEATGTQQGAGIGGGDSGSGGEINIYGGYVHAIATYRAPTDAKGIGAGIGGGDNGDGGIIRIYGGKVYAKSVERSFLFLYDNWGAGIGGGDSGNGGTIEIYGGEIEAHGYHAIGNGKDAGGDSNLKLGDKVIVDGFDYSERYNILSRGRDVWMSELTAPDD